MGMFNFWCLDVGSCCLEVQLVVSRKPFLHGLGDHILSIFTSCNDHIGKKYPFRRNLSSCTVDIISVFYCEGTRVNTIKKDKHFYAFP